MKRCYLRMISLFILASVGNEIFAQGRDAAIEKATHAITSKDYPAAVRICLEELKHSPGDYDVSFLLCKAHAFSNEWDKALAVLDALASAFPDNSDVLVFRARIESWKRNYAAAERGYQRALEIRPRNLEAMIGLAEIASWQGEYARSVSLYDRAAEQYPDNAELAFRLGRVHFWSGNYEKARHTYEKALRLDPQNKEYRKALTTASPRWLKNYEFRYEHLTETFTDERSPCIDRRLAFQLNLAPTGPLVFKASQTERFEKRDYQYDVESYPRLWNRSYAHLNLAISPKAVHYPNHSWLAEVYQGIFSSWEVSLGHRRLAFSPSSTSVYLGSVAYYHGQSIAFLRWYLTQEEGKTAFSWTANLRRYFSETSHLSVGYGMGSKPFDIVTAEDLLVKESWVIFAGLDWRFFRKIRLQLYYHLRDEGPLRRRTFLLCTGYCW